jgi:hypothetical protein
LRPKLREKNIDSTYNGFLSLDFSSDMPEVPRYKNTSGPDYLYANTGESCFMYLVL